MRKMGRPKSDRKCKVKDCERKHSAKGYCRFHYDRKRRGLPFVLRCRICFEELGMRRKKFCSSVCRRAFYYHCTDIGQRARDYMRNERVAIYVAGRQFSVFTDGVTEEIRLMIPELKRRVFEECIRNPRWYLYGDERKKRVQKDEVDEDVSRA